MKLLKYFINIFGSGCLAFALWMYYHLWVQSPIGATENESIELLKNQIMEVAVRDTFWALGIIAIILFITWILQKVEKKQNVKELLYFFIFDCLIVTIGIVLGLMHAYSGLCLDIARNFN